MLQFIVDIRDFVDMCTDSADRKLDHMAFSAWVADFVDFGYNAFWKYALLQIT